MEATTKVEGPEPSSEEREDPRVSRAKARADGDKGREMIEHVIQGASLDPDEEIDALDWLLGDAVPVPYDVTVQLDTPKGRAPLTFVFTAPDGRKLDEIENRSRNPTTGRIDVIGSDIEVVATFTQYVETATGRTMDLKSEDFRRVKQRNARGETESFVLASPIEALERRFRTQLGLLANVAQEIRRTGGWDAARQGQAQRRLVKASLD